MSLVGPTQCPHLPRRGEKFIKTLFRHDPAFPDLVMVHPIPWFDGARRLFGGALLPHPGPSIGFLLGRSAWCVIAVDFPLGSRSRIQFPCSIGGTRRLCLANQISKDRIREELRNCITMTFCDCMEFPFPERVKIPEKIMR